MLTQGGKAQHLRHTELGSWRVERINGINKNVTNLEATCCYSHEMLLPSDSDGLCHCVTSKRLAGLLLN